ncbi:MAG: hypothetical protein K5764_04295 [Prevotella sp.]|nr:hypothetical protein [Prevotella sp.]
MKRTLSKSEPSVMSADVALAWLYSHGTRYEVCDTPVPLVGNTANCGSPSGIGY